MAGTLDHWLVNDGAELRQWLGSVLPDALRGVTDASPLWLIEVVAAVIAAAVALAALALIIGILRLVARPFRSGRRMRNFGAPGVAPDSHVAAPAPVTAPPPPSFADMQAQLNRLAAASNGATKPDPAQRERRDKALSEIAAAAPDTARLIAAGDLARAFASLERDAAAATNAASKWRQLGDLARAVDPGKAREAYQAAFLLQPQDFRTCLEVARLRAVTGDKAGARSAAEAAGRAAASDRERSQAAVELGNILASQGQLPEAMRAFWTGLEADRSIALADPANASSQRDLAATCDRIGALLSGLGKLPEALKAFHESLAIRVRLAQADPGHADGQRSVAASCDLVGDVLARQGNLPEALKVLRDGLGIRDRLAKAEPTNAPLWRELASSCEKFGDVLFSQGSLADAFKASSEGLTIRSQLAKADAANAEWQRDLAVSCDRVGKVLAKQGNLPEALKAYRDGLVISDRLAKADPANANRQRDLSICYERLASVAEQQGDKASAIEAYQKSLALYDALIAARPEAPEFRVYSVVPLWSLGRLEGSAGRPRLGRALGILKELKSADRLDARRSTWIGQIEAQLAALGP